MTIYKHRASVTASSGSTSSTTLNVRGGLCRQIVIRANTSTTVFRANITDENSDVVVNYPYHEGEINDWDICIPMSGKYTVNITNSSPDDTFVVKVGVEE